MTRKQHKGQMVGEGMKMWAEDVECKSPLEFFVYLKKHENDKALYMTADKLNEQKIMKVESNSELLEQLKELEEAHFRNNDILTSIWKLTKILLELCQNYELRIKQLEDEKR